MNDIWTLGFTTGNYASACLLKNSEVMFHTTEETLSNREGDNRPFLLILEVLKYTSKLDCVIHTNEEQVDSLQNDIYYHLLRKLKLFESDKELNNYNIKPGRDKYIAASAFYKSSFTECAVLVLHEASCSLWAVKDHSFNQKLNLKTAIRPKAEDVQRLTGSSNLITTVDDMLNVSWGAAQYMYRYYKWKNM
jgi:predicted NodU family carbamoyl transferase